MTEFRKLSLPVLKRASAASTFDEVDDGSIEFSFSSELPVERWFGTEVISHDTGAVDLSRLNDGAPLLWNHDNDVMVGVVEGARIGEDKRGYCRVRFGTGERAQELAADVRAGVVRNVSVGYRINKMVEDRSESGSTFTATEWMPYEISLVSIPADPSVGIGRSTERDEIREIDVEVRGQLSQPKEIEMSEAAPAVAPVDVSAVRAEAVSAERARIGVIEALGAKFADGDLARTLIENGRSIEDARSAFLEKLGAVQKPVAEAQSGVVDMSEKEQRDYSLVRAINAAVSKDWSKAGLEREASIELGRQMGRETEGFFMPTNLRMNGERAAYATGATATGGAAVATNLLASSFIEVLRNKAVIMNLGPTILSGLVGNVSIPRQISQTATYWVSEATALTEAEATFDQVALSAKQIGARSQYSRLMLQQSTPDIEAVVRNDLAKVMALGIDAAAINGTGTSGQPRGILNQSGIGSVAMGTNGGALLASSTTAGTGIDPLIDLEKALDVANALDGTLSYLTNAKGVAALKKLKDQYGDYIWGNASEDVVAGTAGMINGYRVARSNQVPANLTKGTSNGICSALLFGDFTQLVIGMWGGLEILPNPYGAGYNAGSVDIRAMQTCDIAVRHAESFAAITDLLA